MSSEPSPVGHGGPPKQGMTPLLKVLIGVLFGAVALLVIVVVVGYYVVSRTVRVSESPSGKGVEIQSPIGSLSVKEESAEALLADMGVPTYPGAKPSKGAAQIRVVAGEGGAKINVVALESPDPIEHVDAFYHQQLSKRFRRQTGKMIGDMHGRRYVIDAEDGILYSEEENAKKTYVGLEKKGSGTKIAIVKVVEREAQ
jgi:hypothetical protein